MHFMLKLNSLMWPAPEKKGKQEKKRKREREKKEKMFGDATEHSTEYKTIHPLCRNAVFISYP